VIATVFISDRGEQYLPGCCESFDAKVWGADGPRHLVDDHDHRLGLAGAVQAGWTWALLTGCDYLFAVEEDFRFTNPLNLVEMVKILGAVPYLAQLVLKRQPWSAEEIAAGGQIEVAPDDYTDCDGYVEHTRLFSLNPSLIRREVLELGGGLEVDITQRCLDAGYSFAYFGGRHDPPRCEHVGSVRGSGWRL
jgi:glycosyltransferase involved in cell wall biosynthesis